MINLHESMGPGRDLTRDLSICSVFAARHVTACAPQSGIFMYRIRVNLQVTGNLRLFMPSRWSSLRYRNRLSRAYTFVVF